MKITTEELERCEVLLTIEVDESKVQDILKKAARRIARQVNIPGFRPGKAPFNTVVRRFGWEAVQQEALEQSADKLIKEALAEAAIEPYAQMQLEEINWEPLVLKVKVPVKPILELGNYRDIRLEVEPVEVTDDDVDQALTRLQEQNATWTPVERPSEIGDLISMSVTEKDGDEILAEEESVEYELTAPDDEDSENLPDLTTPLLGLSAGESKTFAVTYPENFNNEQYAGQEITFSVEVSGVKVKELDPLDDDFARQVSEFDTLDALKENIRENIQHQRQRQRDLDLGYEMLDKIIEDAEKIEWPLAFEEENLDDEVKHYEYHLKQSGMTLDSYLNLQNKTEEDLREETREAVVNRIKRGLVLSKIAELEKLNVSESEILEQAKTIADYSGGGDQVWRNILASERQQSLISNDLLSSKTILHLAAIAKGEAPEPGANEVPASEDAQQDTPQEAADESKPENEVSNEAADDESAEEPIATQA